MPKGTTPSRGIRNKNPLNIRRSSIAWKGKLQQPTDRDFEQFFAIEWGIRAAMVNMRMHVTQDKVRGIRTTIKREIFRWAPPTENNSQAYLNFVCLNGHFQPDDEIEPSDKQSYCRLLQAMAQYECGGAPIPLFTFERAYELMYQS